MGPIDVGSRGSGTENANVSDNFACIYLYYRFVHMMHMEIFISFFNIPKISTTPAPHNTRK